MKRAISLLAMAFALAPLLHPAAIVAKRKPKVEVVFILDTTGSMAGLIATAKEKIWSIATSMTQTDPAPEIKMGLVGYRDRGDAYVTKLTDLTGDLDAVYRDLMAYEAGGGGDSPESVNQALHEGIEKISWSAGQDVYKVAFLVGDCPPHMDYQDDVKWTQSCDLALQKGIVINTIQMGNYADTTPIWSGIAQKTEGKFLKVDQNATDVMVETPYDKTIAELSAKLDSSMLYYGSREEQQVQSERKVAALAMESRMSYSSKARRSAFNSSASGAANLYGSQELLKDVEEGKVKVESLAPEALPAPLQAVKPELRRAEVEKLSKERAGIQAELKVAMEKRDAFIKEKAKAKGKKPNSFSDKIYDAVKAQAKKKGIEYKGEAKH